MGLILSSYFIANHISQFLSHTYVDTKLSPRKRKKLSRDLKKESQPICNEKIFNFFVSYRLNWSEVKWLEIAF